MPPPRPYRWNEAARRYLDARGRFVPAVAVRDALDASIDESAGRMRDLSQALREGRVSLADWQLGMAREIRASQLAATALARGGWAQMRPADNGWAGQRIRTQYEYLRRFAEQIERGEQRLDGAFLQRAEQYIKAARTTHEEARRREARRAGDVEERSIRHAQDSCEQCIAEAARGWVPIGELVPVGQRACRANCRCSVEFRAAE